MTGIPKFFAAVTKLLEEFYFCFRGAYHVTSLCGLHPRQGPPTMATSERLGTASSGPPRGAQAISRGCRREPSAFTRTRPAVTLVATVKDFACNKSSNCGGPAVHLVATGKYFGQQLSFYTRAAVGHPELS